MTDPAARGPHRPETAPRRRFSCPVGPRRAAGGALQPANTGGAQADSRRPRPAPGTLL